MNSGTTTSRILLTLLLCGGGAGMWVAPAQLTDAVRSTVRDAARPGQEFANRVAHQIANWREAVQAAHRQQTDFDAFQAELKKWQVRCRRAEITAAQAQEEIASLRASETIPAPAYTPSPLLTAKLVDAAVLGRPSSSPANVERLQRLISGGVTDGITTEDFVLENAELLLDQGESSGITPGQPAFSGRTVVGKVVAAGLWTSTVQLASCEEYRGFARLVRNTPQGALLAGEGILEGTGDGYCRLKFVESREAVQVGDSVFASGQEMPLENSLYYGEVIQAELKPGAPHWEILIRPAGQPENLRHVSVLIQQLNEQRMLAN